MAAKSNLYFEGFFQRDSAAFLALFFRAAGDMVSRLRLPPIFPPLRPISDMMREISERIGLVEGSISVSGSAVERSTMRCAAWFMSEGLLLIRFGIPQVCHGPRQSQNSK